MNKVSFPDGSFAIHNVTHLTNQGKISAWYGKHGELNDCEYVDSKGNNKSIPDRWVNVIRGLQAIGGAYSI